MPSTGRSVARSLIQLRSASTGARLSSDASLWVCRSRIVLTRIESSPRRAKFRERHFGRDVLVYDLDGHPYFSLFWRAVDKVGEHFHALVQFDIRHDVWQRFAKSRRLVLIGRREGVDLAAPAAFDPLRIRRHAIGAQRARIVADVAAVPAFLDVQLVPLQRLPPRTILFVEMREWLRIFLRLRLFRHVFRSRSY